MYHSSTIFQLNNQPNLSLLIFDFDKDKERDFLRLSKRCKKQKKVNVRQQNKSQSCKRMFTLFLFLVVPPFSKETQHKVRGIIDSISCPQMISYLERIRSPFAMLRLDSFFPINSSNCPIKMLRKIVAKRTILLEKISELNPKDKYLSCVIL